MHYLITIAAIVCNIVFTTVTIVIFKLASDHTDKWYFTYMGFGYLIGILPPFFLSIAFRNNNPNVIMAMVGCFLGPTLHATMYLTFRQHLSPIQWSGIGLALIAAVLVQLGPIRETHHFGQDDVDKTIQKEVRIGTGAEK